MSTIEQLRRRFEAAKAERDRAIASLRTNGRSIYSPDEEARRRAEAKAVYARAVREIETAITDVINAAEADRIAASAADPIASFTGADLERAASLRAFVAEDAAALTADELARRIEKALADDDTVMVALLWRYAGRAVATRFPHPQPPELTAALAEVERRLTDTQLLTAAEQVIADAHSLANEMATADYLRRAYPGAEKARPMA